MFFDTSDSSTGAMVRHLGNLSQMEGCFTIPAAKSLNYERHESYVLTTAGFKMFGILCLLHLLEGSARAITRLLKIGCAEWRGDCYVKGVLATPPMGDEDVSGPPLRVRNKSARFSLWEKAGVIGLVEDGIA